DQAPSAHQEDGPPSFLRLRSVARVRARATELRLREDGYEAASRVPFQGVRSRTIALSMVSSLRATAMMATFLGLPAAMRRSKKALGPGLGRRATRAPMNRAVRTLALPPPMKLLPRHWPDWLAMGFICRS